LKFVAVAIAGILLAAVVVAVTPVQAAPYYTTGDHTIRLVVKFTNDNWHEIYARATPKNNNHVLLNYQYVENNDKPDCGPSETIYLYLPFKDAKMVQTKATNENRIRTYVTLELVDESTGETVTKYLAYDKNKRVQDFGTFLMHPPGC
jgi:hypothetical protein